MTACVIDASAVLAHLQGEDGGDAAFEWLAKGAAISIINVQELAYNLARAGIGRADIETVLADLSLDMRPITLELALDAGAMPVTTAKRRPSHADRACLALARALDLPAVTADTPWADLADELGVEVVLIR